MAEGFPPLFLCEEGMTINSQTNKVIYTGNGVATEFAIPFSFLERDHIKVRQKLGDIQTERDDWEIRGGNLVFQTAPETGAEIAVIREVPLTQETDYRENEILPAETLERDFDKLTMQVQQLKEQIDRAVTVDVFDDTQAASLIPSIRKAVSDCQTAVETTAANAQTATEQATASCASAANAATSETNTAAMLGTKADTNLNNLTTAGKEYATDLNFPDFDSGVALSRNQNFTPPANGWIRYYIVATGSHGGGISATIGGVSKKLVYVDGASITVYVAGMLPVVKGREYTIMSSTGGTAEYEYFPSQGGINV